MVGGAFVGLLIGLYVVVLAEAIVLRRGDYVNALSFEQAQQRYRFAVSLAFVVVFAAMGPFVAMATFGKWLRHAVYGLMCAIMVVIGVTLIVAAITGQQPFGAVKGAGRVCIDFARNYAVPMAAVVGPWIGVLVGETSTAEVPQSSQPVAQPATRVTPIDER